MATTKVTQIMTSDRRTAAVARAWAVAQRLPVFGYAEIEVEAQVSRPMSVEIVSAWLADGRIRTRAIPGHAGRKMFELTPDTRDAMDRGTRIRQQLWTAARGLTVFTATDLAAHCTEDLAVTPAEASAFAQMLLKAGYLKVVALASPPAREARYRLLRDTGPKAPRERRITAVWDENEVRYVHIPGHLTGGRVK